MGEDKKQDSCKKVEDPCKKKEQICETKSTPKPEKPPGKFAALTSKYDLKKFGLDKFDLKKINKQTLYSGLDQLKKWIMDTCNPKKMADKPAGRPMKFPYTFSAKIAQFPLNHYIKNQWIWRYYAVSVAICLPVFYSINKLANSPGNVAKWAEIRRKEAAEHHH